MPLCFSSEGTLELSDSDVLPTRSLRMKHLDIENVNQNGPCSNIICLSNISVAFKDESKKRKNLLVMSDADAFLLNEQPLDALLVSPHERQLACHYIHGHFILWGALLLSLGVLSL